MLLYGINFCECWCGNEAKEGNRYINHHCNKGIKFSEGHRKHLSEAHIGKEAWNKGIEMPEETKQQISNSLKGNIPWNKGLTGIYSEETKQQISNSLKGNIPWNKGLKNPYSEETLKQMSESLKGKEAWNKGLTKETDERVKAIAEANIGKEASKETKKKLSESHIGLNTGENHPNWKGGITIENHSLRTSLDYKNWREEIFKRDQYLCHKCNCKGYLHAHHIINFAKLSHKNQYLWDINNGITFCKDCHKQFHKQYGYRNNNQQQIFEFIYLNSNYKGD